ncbi:McrB family protein [Aneurinibacillus sp. REN35]|uniref:McrB family protein n=1 Tax=Aneurinibacillus sp. REN35 TaxID=3237286 RepID=UPI003527656F
MPEEQLTAWLQAYQADEVNRLQNHSIDEARAAFLSHFHELEKLCLGDLTLAQFKKVLDHKTKSKHMIDGKKINIWGFSGFSGQMFFNQIYNQTEYAGMLDELTEALCKAVQIPAHEENEYEWTIKKYSDFASVIYRTQKAAIAGGYPPQKCASVKFATFFLSFFWGLQDLRRYPIFYKADRDALNYFGYETCDREKPFDSAAYVRFVRCLCALRGKLEKISGVAWSLPEVQHFLFYVSRRMTEGEQVEENREGTLEESRTAQRLMHLLQTHNFIVSHAQEVDAVQYGLSEEYKSKVIWRFAGTQGDRTYAYVFIWDVPSEYICTIYEENEEGFLRKLYTIEVEDERTFLSALDAHLGRREVEHRSYTLEDAAADTYLDTKTLAEWLDVLYEKKQMILYGPPGTGKTYTAKRLAKVMAQSDSRICLVQFHPSYTYEEFIEGMRPEIVEGEDGTSHMKVNVKPGLFLELCQEALKQENRDRAYVLIIDEFNRANTAKVFGELLYALEYRNSSIPLPYSRDKMIVPDNVYLIGTMNTTDRSLAQLDFALRRRFPAVYVSVRETERILRAYLLEHHPDMIWIAELVHRANKQINHPDFFLGHSFFMNRGLTDEKFARIWKYEVLPYLEEYFAYEPERLREYTLDALLEREGDTGEGQ